MPETFFTYLEREQAVRDFRYLKISLRKWTNSYRRQRIQGWPKEKGCLAEGISGHEDIEGDWKGGRSRE